jgi:uncharacterized RDD family membrane protein YckC
MSEFGQPSDLDTERDVATGATTSPFAEFERRVAGAIIDLAAIFFLTIWLLSVRQPFGMQAGSASSTFVVIALLYFSASWASPLRATPVQWLLRIRIVDKSGERLPTLRAAVRAVLFVSGTIGVWTLRNVPENPWFLLIVAPSLVMFCAALLTANRQGIHDILAHSVVVMAGTIRSPKCRRELRDRIERNAELPWAMKRPKTSKIVLPLALVFVLVLGTYNMTLVRYEMGLRSRISYAYQQTESLRGALETSYRTTGSWGGSEKELGKPTQESFPDGGYYLLEDGAVIRIRFTVVPKLKRISLLVTPHWEGEELVWKCHVEGEISPGALPAHCRN